MAGGKRHLCLLKKYAELPHPYAIQRATSGQRRRTRLPRANGGSGPKTHNRERIPYTEGAAARKRTTRRDLPEPTRAPARKRTTGSGFREPTRAAARKRTTGSGENASDLRSVVMPALCAINTVIRLKRGHQLLSTTDEPGA